MLYRITIVNLAKVAFLLLLSHDCQSNIFTSLYEPVTLFPLSHSLLLSLSFSSFSQQRHSSCQQETNYPSSLTYGISYKYFRMHI